MCAKGQLVCGKIWCPPPPRLYRFQAWHWDVILTLCRAGRCWRMAVTPWCTGYRSAHRTARRNGSSAPRASWRGAAPVWPQTCVARWSSRLCAINNALTEPERMLFVVGCLKRMLLDRHHAFRPPPPFLTLARCRRSVRRATWCVRRWQLLASFAWLLRVRRTMTTACRCAP